MKLTFAVIAAVMASAAPVMAQARAGNKISHKIYRFY